MKPSRNFAAMMFLSGFLCVTFFTDTLPAQFNNDFYSGVVQPSMQSRREARRAQASRVQTQGAAVPRTGFLRRYPEISGKGGGGGGGNNSTGELDKVNPKVEAILVGINDYSSSGFESLTGCVTDAGSMKSWLEEPLSEQVAKADSVTASQAAPLGGPNVNVVALAWPVELGKAATAKSFLDEVERKINTDCDRLVIHFSGHGIAHPVNTDQPGEMKSCLVFPLAEENLTANPRLYTRIRSALGEEMADVVLVRPLLERLKSARAREVLVILDCCRIAEQGSAHFMNEFQTLARNQCEFFRRPGGGRFAVITGCSLNEQSQEVVIGDKTQGNFTYHFLHGLTTRDADRYGSYDGYITLTEAFNYASRAIAESEVNGQTPEIFIASSTTNMKLLYYHLQKPERLDDETDIQFIIRSGKILANNRFIVENNRLGMELLDCALENVTHDAHALAARASIHRKLGDYEKALRDVQRIEGWEFQLYAQSAVPSGSIQISVAGVTDPDVLRNCQNILAKWIAKDSTLTVVDIENQRCAIARVDNRTLREHLKDAGIPENATIECSIPIQYVYWKRQVAENNIVRTSLNNYHRTTPLNVGGVGRSTPGNRAFIPQ